MNPNLQEALYCYDEYLAKKRDMRMALRGLLREAGFNERKDGVCLELDMSLYIDGDDIEKPRVFLRTYVHTPTVSIQMEQENATPEEIRRLVPYLKSFPEPRERDVLVEAGFPKPTTARDVASPYDLDDTPIVLFVDSLLVGRLPFDLTFEEAVDAANESGMKSLGGVL